MSAEHWKVKWCMALRLRSTIMKTNELIVFGLAAISISHCLIKDKKSTIILIESALSENHSLLEPEPVGFILLSLLGNPPLTNSTRSLSIFPMQHATRRMANN
jgi:hypothetical protein